MNLEIITDLFKLDIYGFTGVAANKDYAGTAFRIMDKMWQEVKSTNLKNKGRNIWVYEPDEKVFAGVELYDMPKPDTELEQKTLHL